MQSEYGYAILSLRTDPIAKKFLMEVIPMDKEDPALVEITAILNDSEEKKLVALNKNDIAPNKLYRKLKTAGAIAELKLAEKICETICNDNDSEDTVVVTVLAKVDAKTKVKKTMEVKRKPANNLSRELGSLRKKIITELPFYIIQCDAFRAI